MSRPSQIDLKTLTRAFDPSFFKLFLFPTEECNFRCTYCYEDFSVGQMSDDIVEGSINLLRNRAPDIRILQLSWFGGEPLLAKDVVIEVAAHAKQMSKEHNWESYASDMTTNGHRLTPRLAEDLCHVGVTKFQISLDGDESAHNLTRKSRKGLGTFSTIWRNLIAIRDSDLPINILLRLHVSPENQQSLIHLIDAINEAFSEDARFNAYLHKIANLGGPNSGSLEVLSEKDADITIANLESMIKHPRPSLTSSKNMDSNPSFCYAAAPNVLAVRANGDIIKCTVMLNDPRNRIGSLNRNGSINVDNTMLREWTKGFRENDVDAIQCPAAHLSSTKQVAAPQPLNFIKPPSQV